jgi:hypothetical protein
MPTDTEYFITPRIPGVRPKDPPDYDGYVFVYVFTRILNPWIAPPVTGQVVVVVDNSQGFVPGMTIAVERAGTYQVVDAGTLNRLTIQNLPNQNNALPGTTIPPGNLTTTSLPGPKGDKGDQGIQGLAATVDVGTTVTSPAGQNATVVNVGTQNQAVFNFTIPRGIVGPQGPQGAPGQAYNNTTSADFTAADAPTVKPLSLQSTTGLFTGVVLDINPIGYYQIQSVISGTQVNVVNTMTPGNSAAGTLAPSGSAVLGTGPQGPAGIPASITAGNTTTGAPGTAAAVTQRGTPSAAIFDFAIPRGDVGATGAPGVAGANGAAGAAATLNVGTTATGAPGTQASVTASGTPQAQVFDFVIPRGDVGATGVAGPTGPQGAAGANGATGADATVNAGTTSTGAPGSNALVTQRGTPGARIFDFTIPRGDVGAQGPAGTTGAAGTAGKNSFTISTANFTVPPVGSTVDVTLADASWVTIGQMIAVQNSGGSATVAGTLQCTAKSGNTITLKNLPGSVIPVADATQDGFLRKVSGLNTDYVDGTNNSRPMGPVIIGGPAGTPSPPSGIIVPRYANHPDTIWTPLSALDDHFDAGSIDPKWTLATTPGMINVTQAQAGSHLSLGGISPNGTDGVFYNSNATTPLPNSNSFTLTVKARALVLSNYGTSGSWGFAWFRIMTAGSSGAEWRFGVNCAVIATTPNVIVFQNLIWGYAGANFVTQSLAMALGKPPEYWRIVYDSASKSTAIWVSDDGQTFQYLSNVAGATSGFSTAPPTRAFLGFTGVNLARGVVHFDWIRFTNP